MVVRDLLLSWFYAVILSAAKDLAAAFGVVAQSFAFFAKFWALLFFVFAEPSSS